MSYRTVPLLKKIFVCRKCIFCSFDETEGMSHQLDSGHEVKKYYENDVLPPLPIRICRVCGKQAFNDKDLELFVRNAESRYGKENRCIDCDKKKGVLRYEKKTSKVRYVF